MIAHYSVSEMSKKSHHGMYFAQVATEFLLNIETYIVT
jgi:hypothetical protein